ncbi:hypothetical protein COB21_01655, partial [Candidatus Aerophobetes bacterium]
MKFFLNLVKRNRVNLQTFYVHNPLFKIALFFSLGIGAFFYPYALICLPFLLPEKRVFIALVVVALGFLHGQFNAPNIALKVPLKGSAILQINSSVKKSTPISTQTLLKGEIKAFYSDSGKSLSSTPFIATAPRSFFKLKSASSYFLKEVELFPLSSSCVYVKIKPSTPPIVVKKHPFFKKIKER